MRHGAAHALPPETSGTGLFLFLRQVKTEPSLATPATILSCLLVAALPSWRCLCHTLWGVREERWRSVKKTRMVLEMLVMWHSKCTADCSKPFLGTC